MELAKRLGCSHWTLTRRYWDMPGRPKNHDPGSGRYDVDAYRIWVQSIRSAHNFGSRDADEFVYKPNEREQALIDRNKISAQRERFKLQVEMAEYIPRLEANRAIETGNRIVLNELQKAFQSELPPRLEGLTSAGIRKVLLAKLRQLAHDVPAAIKKVYANGDNGS
jgi:hypothetical protein